MTNQLKIVISLIGMLIISCSFLAYVEKSQHKIEDSWFLYFNNPQDNSLNFVIENYSDKNNFSWSLIVDGEKIKTEQIKVLKDDKIDVRIEKLSTGKKFSVEVVCDKEKRDIYKTF